MADNISSPDGSSFLSSFFGVLATFVVFALMVILAYGLGWNKVSDEPTDEGPPSAASLRAEDALTLSTYGWVDEEKGIVRVPVDRAKELVIEELNP